MYIPIFTYFTDTLTGISGDARFNPPAESAFLPFELHAEMYV